MFSQIDARSATPLYDQIAARLRIAIAAGELVAGEGLPSVRQLASQLRINPATVAQAYRDLEADGFVEMRQGAGTFVSDVAQEGRQQERRRHAVHLVRKMVAEAGRLRISPEELRAAFTEVLGSRSK
ncbi:MAG: GntR family transcriptional regulator [Gemmatimonadales bacterium]